MVLAADSVLPHDLPPNITALLVAVVTLLGGVGLQKVAKYRAARKPPPLAQETVKKSEFEMLREATEREFFRLEGRIDELSQKLVNRTTQVKAISGAFRALRDFVLTYISSAHRAWENGQPPPELTPDQRLLLDDPLEDDPDVYDTMTRAEFVSLRDNPPPPDPHARRRRH